jgi:hypothetical protein
LATLTDTIHRVLSLTREAGSKEAAEARSLVAAHLTDLGYTVTVQKFSFAPSSLLAFPFFGAGLGGLGLVLFPFLNFTSTPDWAALAVWIAGLLGLLIVAGGIGLGWVPLRQPAREDANLIATRQEQPRRWIVAHLDSKAQGHSMAGRLVAVWVTAFTVVVLTILVLLRLRGPVDPFAVVSGSCLGVIAGALAGRGRIRGRSRGARDNGSGVVAALKAAESTTDPRIGILITGAEEFGLVGARIFARASGRLENTEFVNLDTLDQQGGLFLVSHDRRGAELARTMQPQLSRLGIPVRLRRLPLGIFVDSAPLSRTNVPALTIGRLNWNTLRRIHTPRDTPDGLSLELAERVGQTVVQIDL